MHINFVVNSAISRNIAYPKTFTSEVHLGPLSKGCMLRATLLLRHVKDWDPSDNDIHNRVPAHRAAISPRTTNFTPKVQYIRDNPLTLSMIHP